MMGIQITEMVEVRLEQYKLDGFALEDLLRVETLALRFEEMERGLILYQLIATMGTQFLETVETTVVLKRLDGFVLEVLQRFPIPALRFEAME
jgi:hypothetical protein